MDSEALAAWVGLGLAFLVFPLGAWVWHTQSKLIRLEAWKETHHESDIKTHSELKDGIKAVGDQITHEIGLMRAESTEQHNALRVELSSAITAAVKDGQEQRRAVHKDVADLSASVNQLIGAHKKEA